MNNDSDDVVARLKNGHAVDIAKFLKAEKQNELARAARQDNEVVVLQLLVARMEKAIGKHVRYNTLMASLAILAAKVIGNNPQKRHGELLVAFATQIKTMLEHQFPAPPEETGEVSTEDPAPIDVPKGDSDVEG